MCIRDRLQAWRAERDEGAVRAALSALREASGFGQNVMGPSIACAKAGVTTGEWGAVMREIHGEFRAPTGVGAAVSNAVDGMDAIRARMADLSGKLGCTPRFLVGKLGLDGHSNGAEQIAARARDAGVDVTYEGIRVTPAEIVERAAEVGAHVVGLSVLSGSHLPLVEEVMTGLRARGLDLQVVVGGIVPEEDARALKEMGVAQVFTPKDFDLNAILFNVADLIDPNPAPVAAE